jgi:hypothetical protein
LNIEPCPFLGGEDGLWAGVLHQVAYHLGTLGHKKAFAPAELLGFQLTDKFYLVFANHFAFCLQR